MRVTDGSYKGWSRRGRSDSFARRLANWHKGNTKFPIHRYVYHQLPSFECSLKPPVISIEAVHLTKIQSGGCYYIWHLNSSCIQGTQNLLTTLYTLLHITPSRLISPSTSLSLLTSCVPSSSIPGTCFFIHHKQPSHQHQRNATMTTTSKQSMLYVAGTTQDDVSSPFFENGISEETSTPWGFLVSFPMSRVKTGSAMCEGVAGDREAYVKAGIVNVAMARVVELVVFSTNWKTELTGSAVPRLAMTRSTARRMGSMIMVCMLQARTRWCLLRMEKMAEEVLNEERLEDRRRGLEVVEKTGGHHM
ncbi:hypothetical protein BKA66DRAFT_41452 [Pyrenochaeta sp. MPI-SDFR-AT-0127]|nr:hypothetical protein BKA66DRAFT_41452 [Pyrenochaeta sp. MPI-SDFR-AT-0127]